jgi:hypothetical protein
LSRDVSSLGSFGLDLFSLDLWSLDLGLGAGPFRFCGSIEHVVCRGCDRPPS